LAGDALVSGERQLLAAAVVGDSGGCGQVDGRRRALWVSEQQWWEEDGGRWAGGRGGSGQSVACSGRGGGGIGTA